MSNAKSLSIGGMTLPLDLDAVETLPMGGGGAQFDFHYRGIRFAGQCVESDGGATLKLAGDVGRLPFSAEAPAARSGLSFIIMHANGLLGRVFRLVDDRIVVGREVSVATPVTATALVAAVATVLIPVAPYLDLAAVYFEPGGERLKPEWRVRARPAGAATLPPPRR